MLSVHPGPSAFWASLTLAWQYRRSSRPAQGFEWQLWPLIPVHSLLVKQGTDGRVYRSN